MPTGTVDLVIDHLVLAHVLADGARNREHVAQVRRAVLVRRRAHRDQLELSVLDALFCVGGEVSRPAATLRSTTASRPGS